MSLRRHAGRAVALVIVVALAACGGHGAGPVATTFTSGPSTSATTPATTAAPPTSVTASPSTSATTTTSPTTTTTTVPSTTTTVPRTTTTQPSVVATRVWRGDATRRRVALTFDAGSDAGNTTAILGVLAAHHLHATFGITGDWARANPALLRRIVAAGHQLLNHTDTHDSFTGVSTHTAPLTEAQRVAQITGGERAIVAVTGSSPKPWFRPPYGDIDAATDALLGRLGYRYDVLWTVDSLGWKGTTAASVVARCLAGAGNGVIYLFHVGGASTDAAALPAIVSGLEARGYAIGTVASVL